MDVPMVLLVGIIAVAVIFGAKKIPEIARGVGQAQSEFKKGLKEGAVDDEPAAEKPKSPEAD